MIIVHPLNVTTTCARPTPTHKNRVYCATTASEASEGPSGFILLFVRNQKRSSHYRLRNRSFSTAWQLTPGNHVSTQRCKHDEACTASCGGQGFLCINIRSMLNRLKVFFTHCNSYTSFGRASIKTKVIIGHCNFS